jgi:hypothetical protein
MDSGSEHFVSLTLHMSRKEHWMLKANTSSYADKCSIPELILLDYGNHHFVSFTWFLILEFTILVYLLQLSYLLK